VRHGVAIRMADVERALGTSSTLKA